MEFITKMYQNENFPIYLGVIIVILIIIFFIVFMLGKKDGDDVSKTKKIEKIDNNGINPNEEEIPMIQENPVLLNETVKKIDLDDTNDIKEEPISIATIASNIEQEVKSYIDSMKFEDEDVYADTGASESIDDDDKVISLTTIANNIEKEVEGYITSMPTPEPEAPETKAIENEQPFAEEEYTSVNDMLAKDREMLEETNRQIEKYKSLAASIEKELIDLEQNRSVSKPILSEEKEELLPAYKDNNETKTVEVYSSVSVPKKDENLINDTMQIELPKLKK